MTPYKEQIDAVNAALRHHRGVISMPTGVGKSLTMTLLVEALQVRTLIVVPNVGLKEQLRSTFRDAFGDNPNVVIENIDSPALENLTDFDCLIIDEAHHVAARTYRRLNATKWTGIYYRFFFTATPFRSRDEEQILFESVAGRLIYRVSYQTAVGKGYIVPIEAYYFELPRQYCRGYTWKEIYGEQVIRHSLRNRLIADIMNNLISAGKSTLCLVKEKEHGRALKYLVNLPVNFVSADEDNSAELIDQFAKGVHPGLIATAGICGEGRDTKAAEYIIIAGLGKSKNAFMQQIGRGVRRFGDKESCKVFIFRDRSHKFTERHFKAQCKILKEEYGIIPAKMSIA